MYKDRYNNGIKMHNQEVFAITQALSNVAYQTYEKGYSKRSRKNLFLNT
jgi:hypothetical protein